MDRERRLLYAVAILAPICELLMFLQWHYPDLPARTALIEQVHSCQDQLLRSWAQCAAPAHKGSI
jgi:hypothetical protein